MENKKQKKIFSKSSKILSVLISAAAGAVVGFSLFEILSKSFASINTVLFSWLIPGVVIFIFASLGIVFLNALYYLAKFVEKKLSRFSGMQIAMGLGGIVSALVLVVLLNLIFPNTFNAALNTLLAIVLAFVLARVGSKLVAIKTSQEKLKSEPVISSIKIIDSSAIIDGRFVDIVNTNIIDGKIVIPKFIEKEILGLSINEDENKKIKGERGLKIINLLKEQNLTPVEVGMVLYNQEKDINQKLINYCLELNAKLVTVNTKMLRLCAKHNIGVININDIANAIKPVLLAGETTNVKIIKEGEDREQGIAFTPNGSMIIVEGAKHLIGQNVDITITTSLQTSKGVIIFSKLKSS